MNEKRARTAVSRLVLSCACLVRHCTLHSVVWAEEIVSISQVAETLRQSERVSNV